MSRELYRAIYILFGFVEIFCYYRFLNHKLTYRFPKCTLPIAFIVSCALRAPALFGNIQASQRSLSYLLLILSTLSMCVIYKDTIIKIFSNYIIVTFMHLTCETIAIPITMLATGSPLKYLNKTRISNSILIILTYILLILAVEYLVRTKRKIFDDFSKNAFFLILINVVYHIVVVQFYHSNIRMTTERAIFVSYLVVTVTTFLTIFLLDKITKKSEEIMTNNLKMQQIEMEHKQNQDMAIVVEDLRALRHDMNNHMSILQGLLEIEELEDAKTYLANITQELSAANSFVFTDNKILSVLLNNKISKAQSLGITFDTALLTSSTPFSDSDLCAVVGNIIENAIEAASKHENPYICFSMQTDKKQLLIQCDNTYSIAPVIENGNFVTTKADKAYHGIGTKTIRSVVADYQGSTEFIVDELFHVKIAIPMCNDSK